MKIDFFDFWLRLRQQSCNSVQIWVQNFNYPKLATQTRLENLTKVSELRILGHWFRTLHQICDPILNSDAIFVISDSICLHFDNLFNFSSQVIFDYFSFQITMFEPKFELDQTFDTIFVFSDPKYPYFDPSMPYQVEILTLSVRVSLSQGKIFLLEKNLNLNYLNIFICPALSDLTIKKRNSGAFHDTFCISLDIVYTECITRRAEHKVFFLNIYIKNLIQKSFYAQ